jgi:hypothetical protein
MFKMVKIVFYFLKGIVKIYYPFLPAEWHLLDSDIFVPISKYQYVVPAYMSPRFGAPKRASKTPYESL